MLMLRLIAENWEGIAVLVGGEIRTIRVRPSLKSFDRHFAPDFEGCWPHVTAVLH